MSGLRTPSPTVSPTNSSNSRRNSCLARRWQPASAAWRWGTTPSSRARCGRRRALAWRRTATAWLRCITASARSPRPTPRLAARGRLPGGRPRPVAGEPDARLPLHEAAQQLLERRPGCCFARSGGPWCWASRGRRSSATNSCSAEGPASTISGSTVPGDTAKTSTTSVAPPAVSATSSTRFATSRPPSASHASRPT